MSRAFHPSSLATLPAAVRGALWTVAASFCMVCFAAIAKQIAQQLPLMEIVFFRAVFGIFFLLPWLARNGLAGMRTRRPLLMASRGLNTMFGLYCVFAAVSLMPIADVIVIMYSKPILASLAAVLILGEIMYVRRWFALAAGIIGMLIIVRPGFADMNLGVLFALGAMASGAYTTITVKYLTRTEKPDAIVSWTVASVLVVSAVPAVVVWQTPDTAQLMWLVALGGLATGFQRCMTRAYAAADATAVMPFEFSRLIFAAVIGFVVFGDVPDMWTWAGGMVIFAAALYMVHRETKRRKPAAADADPA